MRWRWRRADRVGPRRRARRVRSTGSTPGATRRVEWVFFAPATLSVRRSASRVAAHRRPRGPDRDRDAVVPLGVRLRRVLPRARARHLRAVRVGRDHGRDADQLDRDRDRGAAQRAVLDPLGRGRSTLDDDDRPAHARRRRPRCSACSLDRARRAADRTVDRRDARAAVDRRRRPCLYPRLEKHVLAGARRSPRAPARVQGEPMPVTPAARDRRVASASRSIGDGADGVADRHAAARTSHALRDGERSARGHRFRCSSCRRSAPTATRSAHS